MNGLYQHTIKINMYRENGKIAIIIFRFTSPNLSEVYDRKKHQFENTFHRN